MTEDTAAPLALPRAPRPGDLLDVTFGALDASGCAVASVDLLVGPQRAPRTFRVIVPGALPGEHATVKVLQRHRGELGGMVETLHSASPDRVAPRCAHAHPYRLPGQTCGGCALQHLPAAHQRAHKHRVVRTLLDRAGVPADVLQEVRPPPSDWRYRNKMEFSVAAGDDGRVAMGLRPPGYRYDVVTLGECHLVSEPLSRWLPLVNARIDALGLRPFGPREPEGFLRHVMTREARATDDRMLEVVTTAVDPVPSSEGSLPAREAAERMADLLAELGRQAGAEFSSVWWSVLDAQRGRPTRMISTLLDGAPVIREVLHVPGAGELTFEIHPRAFFQPNPAAAELIYGLVLEESGLRDSPGAGVALDLYCGTGTIALVLAGLARRVVGIELQADAVDNAREAALLNARDNVTFHAGDVSAVVAAGALDDVRDDVEVIVVDPPRSGLIGGAIAHLNAFPARRLVYVSCNPKALARDAALLAEAGWRLVRATPVDQFPQTPHIETVARFER